VSVRIVLVSEHAELREQFSGMLLEAHDLELVDVVTDPRDAALAAARDDIDVVIVDEALSTVSAGQLTRELVTARPFLAVVWIASPQRPEVYNQAMIAGARSVVLQPLSVESCRANLGAAAEWSRALRDHLGGTGLVGAHRGRVVALVGAKGGVGTTLLATLLAARSRAPGHAVVLVDLDLRHGAVAYYTDVVARRSIADLAEVAQELTNRSVREVVADHPSGLTLVLAPEEVERAEEVTGPAVRQILAHLRMQFDLVVVDCGSHLDDATAMALEVADDVLLVATADVVALRAARRAVESWKRLSIRGDEHVSLVLNRVSRRSEVQSDLARQIVPVPLIAQVPAAFSSLEAQVNTGLLEGKPGPVHGAVAGLVRTVLEAPHAHPQAEPDDVSRGRRGRARTDLGQVVAELPLIVAAVCALGALAAQLLLFGVSHLFARHAADECARTAAVTNDPKELRKAADRGLPDGWDEGFTVSRPNSTTVKVRVRTPTLVPGLGGGLDVTATAHILGEQS